MSYVKQTWVDRAIEFFRRFSVAEDSAGNITLTEEAGTITEAGTPVNAEHLNHMEDGIKGAHDDLAAHLADYEAKIPWDDEPIISSGGSAATGYWTKFPTGLMMAWREVTLDLSSTSLQSFSMPQTFLANPSASMSTDESTTGGTDFSLKRSAANSCPIANTTNEWRIRLGTTYAGTISARLTAIGRWK